MRSKVITERSLEIASAIAVLLDCDNDYDDSRIHTVDALLDTFKKKVDISSGAYRTAAIFDTFVVKFSLESYRHDKLGDEARFIHKMQRNAKYARHFPETHFFNIGTTAVLIQEKINMKRSRRITELMEAQAVKLGEFLGIDDVHSANYGWKGSPGREYPVFIDVDLRVANRQTAQPTKLRSWMIV
jgi:hypothetical protein